MLWKPYSKKVFLGIIRLWLGCHGTNKLRIPLVENLHLEPRQESMIAWLSSSWDSVKGLFLANYLAFLPMRVQGVVSSALIPTGFTCIYQASAIIFPGWLVETLNFGFSESEIPFCPSLGCFNHLRKEAAQTFNGHNGSLNSHHHAHLVNVNRPTSEPLPESLLGAGTLGSWP